MSQYRAEAESLAIALELGFIPVSQAVAWADVQIAASDVPHIGLCDVSMASRHYPQDVVSMLRSLPDEFDHNDAVRGAVRLGLAQYRAGALNSRDFARGLYHLAVAEDLPDGDFIRHAYGFWDGIDLARQGIGVLSESEIVHDMVRMTTEFVGDVDG